MCLGAGVDRCGLFTYHFINGVYLGFSNFLVMAPETKGSFFLSAETLLLGPGAE